jgi:N-acetylglucosamine kinase-like BadF-type ATPase
MIFLGIDGGGTSTRALATSETGEVLGSGESGPSNPLTVGWEAAVAAIREAAQATNAALPVDAAFLGLAGVGREAGRTRMLGMLHEAPLARRMELGIDAEIALAGAHAGKPGAIVAAGTGAIALAKDREGNLHRADGWGHLLGDEGSGYWIGREALRWVCRIADGRAVCSSKNFAWGGRPARQGRCRQSFPFHTRLRRVHGRGAREAGGVGPFRHVSCFEDCDVLPTSLTAAVLQHFGVLSLSELVTRVYDVPPKPAEIAALAPAVTACAEAGDDGAEMILALAGYELAHAARAVLRAAGLQRGPLSYTGGVFRAGRLVLDPFIKHVRAGTKGIVIHPPLMSPVEGAALLARTLR